MEMKKTNLRKARNKNELKKFISDREPLEADQHAFDRLAEAMALGREEKPPEEDQT